MQEFKELFYLSFGATLGFGLGLTIVAALFILLDKVI